MDADVIEGLVERGDVDGLVRAVDALCTDRAWSTIWRLRAQCRAALDTGRQLWAVAALCEYRLALEGPGEWAARAVLEGTGRFTLGPLTEVAASTHRWAELAPHLTPGPAATYVAHERIIRGEVLDGEALVDAHVLDLPCHLLPWEPVYAVATYGVAGAEFPTPATPPPGPFVECPAGAPTIDDHDVDRAWHDLVAPWAEQSNGRVSSVAVAGDAAAAVAALGVARARLTRLTPGQAIGLMAWAGASGGAHGRRRGGAAGRFGAWWTAARLAGLDAGDDVDPEELGHDLAALGWYAWDAAEPDLGWNLRLAVDDPDEGRAWAVLALDAA